MASPCAPEAQPDTRNLKETLTFHQRVSRSIAWYSQVRDRPVKSSTIMPVLQAGGAGYAGMAAEDLCGAR